MAKEKMSKKQLIKKLLPHFMAYGYDGASLSSLAAAAALSKPSLYHHFPGGKEAMARFALAIAGADMQALILAPLQRQSLTPHQAVHQSLQGVLAYYQGDMPICLMNSMTLGEGRTLFATEIEAAFSGWQRALAKRLSEAGLPAEAAGAGAADLIQQIQGSLILCRLQNSRLPLEAAVDRQRAALDALVTA